MARQNSKQKILDAAIKVFAEKGYNGASTREIAAEAGVSEGSIFKHFSTKHDILLTALDNVIDVFSNMKSIKPLTEILEAGSSEHPKAAFFEIAKEMARVFRENSALIKIVLTESLFDKSISGKFYYTVRTKLFPVLHEHIRAGTHAGSFKDMGMEGDMVAIRAFVSMLAGYVFQRNYAPELIPVDEDKDIELMVDIFIKGIVALEK